MSTEGNELFNGAGDALGLAQVPRIPQYPHAKSLRDQAGLVARAIVDDEHVFGAETRREHAGYRVAEHQRLIEAGNETGQP